MTFQTMGWYYTCTICGKQEKYGPGCTCEADESKQVLLSLQGGSITDTFMNDDGLNLVLYQEVQYGGVVATYRYIATVVRSGSGEYACHRYAWEMTKEEYERAKTASQQDEVPTEDVPVPAAANV